MIIFGIEVALLFLFVSYVAIALRPFIILSLLVRLPIIFGDDLVVY